MYTLEEKTRVIWLERLLPQVLLPCTFLLPVLQAGWVAVGPVFLCVVPYLSQSLRVCIHVSSQRLKRNCGLIICEGVYCILMCHVIVLDSRFVLSRAVMQLLADLSTCETTALALSFFLHPTLSSLSAVLLSSLHPVDTLHHGVWKMWGAGH